MNNKKNRKLLNLNIQHEQYDLLVSIKKTIIDESQAYYFFLKERDTEELIYLNCSTTDHDETFYTYCLTFPYSVHYQTLIQNNIWDLYFSRTINDEEKQSRIKSNYDKLRFNAVVLPDEEKMFYPFTTNRGNVSFRINDYILFAEADHININKEYVDIGGYFNWPPLYKETYYELSQLNLVIADKEGSETKLPLDITRRDDVYEQFKGNENILYSGFEGQLNLLKDFPLHESSKYKFYIEMTYLYRGEKYSIRSIRLRLNHLNAKYPVKRIITSERGKMKMTIKPSKRAKLLSFTISRFKLIKEIKRNVKSTWVKLRRSNGLQTLYKYAFYLLGKLPTKKGTVVFESFLGKQYSDNPRAIYEYIKANNRDYVLYWSADRRHIQHFKDKQVPVIRRFSVKWLFAMARAEYWVSNSRLPLWIPKPKHTTYLQTWHGTPLKRLAADMEEVHMPGTNTEKYKQNFLKATRKWDFLVSPNAYSTEIFRRAFDYSNPVIEAGYPRNDFLINADNQKTRSDIKRKIGIPEGKTVILYAPTWRDNQFYGRGRYRFNLEMDLQKMRQTLGDDYIIVLRLHYLVAESLNLTGFEDFVYDLSTHEDIRELYMISDMLVTDYSSVFFDYANLKRPMMFFVYDLEDYRDNLRGFYFDFEAKAPGPLVKTTDEIIQFVLDIETNGFQPSANTEAFYRRFCYLEDGHASERVVNQVFR